MAEDSAELSRRVIRNAQQDQAQGKCSSYTVFLDIPQFPQMDWFLLVDRGSLILSARSVISSFQGQGQHCLHSSEMIFFYYLLLNTTTISITNA